MVFFSHSKGRRKSYRMSVANSPRCGFLEGDPFKTAKPVAYSPQSVWVIGQEHGNCKELPCGQIKSKGHNPDWFHLG